MRSPSKGSFRKMSSGNFKESSMVNGKEEGNTKEIGKWSLFWRLDRFLPSEMESCLNFQRINHFPKSLEITRKVRSFLIFIFVLPIFF